MSCQSDACYEASNTKFGVRALNAGPALGVAAQRGAVFGRLERVLAKALRLALMLASICFDVSVRCPVLCALQSNRSAEWWAPLCAASKGILRAEGCTAVQGYQCTCHALHLPLNSLTL